MSRMLKIAISRFSVGCLVIGSFFVTSLSLTARAQDGPELIDSYRDWDAYIRYEQGDKICYMVTVPTLMLPEEVDHGDVMLMVTHMPKKQRWDEVMLTTGYDHEEDSTVVLSIGETEEEMFTSKDAAWLWDKDIDQRVVDAIRRGRFMVSKGKSLRGTVVEYHYSLSGASAAHRAINRACNR